MNGDVQRPISVRTNLWETQKGCRKLKSQASVINHPKRKGSMTPCSSACIFKDSCGENFLSKDSRWAAVISGLLTVQLSSLAALGDNLQNNRPSLLFLHCAIWDSPLEDVDEKAFLQSYLFTKHRSASLVEQVFGVSLLFTLLVIALCSFLDPHTEVSGDKLHTHSLWKWFRLWLF